MFKNLTLLITPLFLLFSCESEPDSQELINTRKGDAEKKFEQFYACYEIAKTALPIKNDRIDFEQMDVSLEYGESNVYQIGFESFKDLSKPLEIPLDGTRRREHADMAILFDIDLSEYSEPHDYPVKHDYSYNEIDTPGESVCAHAILHFLNTKYLLINRVYDFRSPIILPEKQFVPGYSKGDVLVFDVFQTKLLGGFKFDVSNADSYNLKEGHDAFNNIEASLSMRVYDQIKYKFKDMSLGTDAKPTFEL